MGFSHNRKSRARRQAALLATAAVLLPPHRAPKNNGCAISRDLGAKLVNIDDLAPLGRATRIHSPKQIRKIAANIHEFGLARPILVDGSSRVVDGWGLVLAARTLGLLQVPAIIITDLKEGQLRTLRLALNRLPEDSRWNMDEIPLEISEILDFDTDINIELSGFDMGEIDAALKGSDEQGIFEF